MNSPELTQMLTEVEVVCLRVGELLLPSVSLRARAAACQC